MIQRKYNSTWHVDDDEHNQDGTEVEVTEYPYFDDNLDLAGSTHKVIDANTGKFFAFIDFSADGNDGSIRECPHCLTFKIHNKLGPKIKKDGERPEPDDDKFLSCYECGNTYPIHETFTESKIKDSIETTDNPFESNESIFMSVGNRKKKDRLNKYQDEDPEIAEEIRKHGDKNVRINE